MPRNPRLRDWPERLKRLTIEQLQEERSYWQHMERILGHPQARKGAAKYVRDVEKELARRENDAAD